MVALVATIHVFAPERPGGRCFAGLRLSVASAVMVALVATIHVLTPE